MLTGNESYSFYSFVFTAQSYEIYNSFAFDFIPLDCVRNESLLTDPSAISSTIPATINYTITNQDSLSCPSRTYAFLDGGSGYPLYMVGSPQMFYVNPGQTITAAATWAYLSDGEPMPSTALLDGYMLSGVEEIFEDPLNPGQYIESFADFGDSSIFETMLTILPRSCKIN